MSESRIDSIEREQEIHTERLDRLEQEEQRTRRRLHDLESDRAALRHLTALAAEVFEAARSLQENAIGLVEQASSRAVDKAFARRGEQRWKLALRVSTILGSIGAILFGLWTIIHG